MRSQSRAPVVLWRLLDVALLVTLGALAAGCSGSDSGKRPSVNPVPWDSGYALSGGNSVRIDIPGGRNCKGTADEQKTSIQITARCGERRRCSYPCDTNPMVTVPLKTEIGNRIVIDGFSGRRRLVCRPPKLLDSAGLSCIGVKKVCQNTLLPCTLEGVREGHDGESP
jgi:hypothetical protein